MKTDLSFSSPADVQTECLVVVALDHGDNNKPAAKLETTDPALQQAAADVLATGDITGKIFEITLVHKPTRLKAKRLLVVGGGRAKNFSPYELRRVAGAAVRSLKARSLRNFACVAPPSVDTSQAVAAIVEGAFVGDFDPDTYKSDRKDQRIEAVTVIASGDQNQLRQAAEQARIIGESQNFTRQLVNEPSNRMTPTVLAEQARKMCAETGLQCEVYGADKIKELKMGAFWSVAQGSD